MDFSFIMVNKRKIWKDEMEIAIIFSCLFWPEWIGFLNEKTCRVGLDFVHRELICCLDRCCLLIAVSDSVLKCHQCTLHQRRDVVVKGGAEVIYLFILKFWLKIEIIKGAHLNHSWWLKKNVYNLKANSINLLHITPCVTINVQQVSNLALFYVCFIDFCLAPAWGLFHDFYFIKHLVCGFFQCGMQW